MAKIQLWTTTCGVCGFVLAVRGVISPLSMLLVGFYQYANFAIIAHHSLHGGWGMRRRGWFAQGSLWRRIVDWLDWIHPDAWINEHNKIHHYRLNEDDDPDFVQRNTGLVRMFPTKPLRYVLVGVNASVWKWAYYASNTLKMLRSKKPNAPSAEELEEPLMLMNLFWKVLCLSPWHISLAAELFFQVMGPVLVANFLLFPGCAAAIGACLYGYASAWPFFWTALVNSAGAELVNNVHGFNTIVTNHSGADLWHFKDPCKADTAEFYLRAILGSTAYHAGSDPVDYFHGYLNYQGEHHAFPSLSPLHYQRLHPHFKSVCAKHGVPYVQEPVWVRVMKTAQIIEGSATHRSIPGQATEQPHLWMTA